MSSSVIPGGNYELSKRVGQLIFTSGITPKVDGKLVARGKVSGDAAMEEYAPVVEQAVKNALSVIGDKMESDEVLDQVVSMTVYVSADEDYTEHSKVADIASNYLYKEYGQKGIGTRAAVGVSSLPGDAPVEIQLIVSVKTS